MKPKDEESEYQPWGGAFDNESSPAVPPSPSPVPLVVGLEGDELDPEYLRDWPSSSKRSH